MDTFETVAVEKVIHMPTLARGSLRKKESTDRKSCGSFLERLEELLKALTA